MKICTKCGEEKSLSEFHKDSTRKDGLDFHCKACKSKRRTTEKRREYDRKQYHKTKEERKQKRLAYREKNRERETARAVQWQKDNPHKVKEKTAKRKASKLQRTPPWSEQDKIALIYEHCERLNKLWGTNFEVDHFIPLQGEDVSGLHCWDNLQLLDRSLNASKNNRNPLCLTHS